MDDLIQKSRTLAYSEFANTGLPIKYHIDYACEVSKRIAKIVGADEQIVEIGTLLMDCAIGEAIRLGRLDEHIQMSLEKVEMLLHNAVITEAEKEKIRHCITEHHGVYKFYSIESEVCCNADCYRFISVKGFYYAFRYMDDMQFSDLVKFLEYKADEKWKVVSLEICRNELAPEFELIKNTLAKL